MTPQECPYCQNPLAYDLFEAVEISTLATSYKDAPHDRSTREKVETWVTIQAHLSRHPIRDQRHFHVPCQGNP